MNNYLISTLLFPVGGPTMIGCTNARLNQEVKRAEDQVNLYELRTYVAAEGKLPALESRFSDHTMALFERHGMKNVVYWRATDRPNTLVYVIGHRNPDAAKASWRNFVNDPEWKEVFRKSRIDGPLVVNIESTFLETTEFSPKP